jgi:hypothetical protein
MSKCCVSLSWMVMQGEHTGVYPGSGKRRPYVQRGGEVCISLHRSARVGVTSISAWLFCLSRGPLADISSHFAG